MAGRSLAVPDTDGDAGWERRPITTRALLSVWLYGFMTGVANLRKLEAAALTRYRRLGSTGCFLALTTHSLEVTTKWPSRQAMRNVRAPRAYGPTARSWWTWRSPWRLIHTPKAGHA